MKNTKQKEKYIVQSRHVLFNKINKIVDLNLLFDIEQYIIKQEIKK